SGQSRGVGELHDEFGVARVVIYYQQPLARNNLHGDGSQADAEGRPDVFLAFECDGAAVQLDESLRECEPQSRPRGLGAALVQAFEPAKHAIPAVLRDADTRVAHLQSQVTAV